MQEHSKKKKNVEGKSSYCTKEFAIRTHSQGFKGRSEYADTEELALATNSGTS